MNHELIALLLVLQGLDAWTTYRILDAGGRERNPFMRFLIGKLDLVPAVLLSKSGYVALLLGVAPSLPAWALAALCIAYVWVVWRNAAVMDSQALLNEKV